MKKSHQSFKVLIGLFLTLLIINSCGKSTVEPEGNQNPTIVTPLANLIFTEGFGTHTIDLSTAFEDPDNDALTLKVQSSQVEVTTVSLSGTSLNITEIGVGKTTISVSADDGKGGTTDTQFTVRVEEKTSPNNLPVVANALASLELDEGFSTHQIDIATVFTDADGDNLNISVSSSNESVATASLSGTTLTLSEKGSGTTTIDLTADDGKGGSVSTEFNLKVIEAITNNAPTIVGLLSDLNLDEGFSTHQIDIATIFTDEDEDILSFSVSSSKESVATASVSGTTLTLSEKGNGNTTITLTADDGKGGTASTGFGVTVTGATVSFANQVKSIIDINCAISGCHVAGTGRQNFTVFATIQANADGIKARTASGNMPRGGGSLNADEKKLIADWVDQGAKDN